MNAASILTFLTKGLGVVNTLWDNQDLAKQAFDSIMAIINKKNVTQADLDETEKQLDALLTEFNAPLPPDPA